MRFWLRTRHTFSSGLQLLWSNSKRGRRDKAVWDRRSVWVSDEAKLYFAVRQGRRVLRHCVRSAGWCQPPKWVGSSGQVRELRYVGRHRGRRRCRQGCVWSVSWWAESGDIGVADAIDSCSGRKSIGRTSDTITVGFIFISTGLDILHKPVSPLRGRWKVKGLTSVKGKGIGLSYMCDHVDTSRARMRITYNIANSNYTVNITIAICP